MGQVFTWDTVRHGRVPLLVSFTEVVAALRQEIIEVPSILSALVCGSVIRGDHTVRSDIDCLVVYDHGREDEAFRYMQKATSYAAAKHVPLGFIPCDLLLAGTRMHHVGTSFRQHLEKSVEVGGLLKGDPLAHFANSSPVQEELESYMRVKMYSLQEAWSQVDTFSDERAAAYLRKLLEAPLHIARKTLAYREQLAADSKVYILQRYAETMPPEMANQLELLTTIDKWYTQELLAAVNAPEEGSYRTILQFLRAMSGEVLKFIRSNLAYVAATAR